jgi:bifunctional DNA-binding transcriptional regulator/antitoxin component of YhaV-PrlF toxin-antitoxin module
MRSNFKEGDNLIIVKRGDELLIKKEKIVVENLADAKLLSEDWLSKEDEEAWKNL